MFAENRTNTNRLDTSKTSFVNSIEPSLIGSNNDFNLLKTDSLFTETPSSSSANVPDLIIENATNTERAIAGTKITLSLVEKNIGSGDAGRHYVGFYLSRDDKWDSDDTLLETNSFYTLESLGAGSSISQTKEFTLDKNISTGDYYVLYIADDWSDLNESNETNNVFAKKINIKAPSPDLIVQNGEAPDTAKAGQKIKLSYREENIGLGDAGEHRVSFFLSKDDKWDSNDIRLGENSVKRLRAGKYVNRTKSFTLDNNLACGDYYVLYVSDDNYSVNESNETNNVFAKKITIQDAKGNAGTHNLDDTEPPIEPTPTPSQPIDENNEDSLEIEKLSFMTASPDLIVEVENDKSPERAKAGSEIKLSYEEKNVGSGEAGEHRVGFYLSKDGTWDSNDILLGEDSVKHIGAGKYISHTKTFSLDNNLASGDYYLLYVGDNKSNINETDETNNVVAKKITIKGKS